MEERQFSYRIQKNPWWIYPILLFSTAGFVTIIIDMVNNFRFFKVIIMLILGIVIWGSLDALLTKRDQGVIISIDETGYKTKNAKKEKAFTLSWDHIKSVKIVDSKIKHQKKLIIKWLPTPSYPTFESSLEVLEENVDDFEAFSTLVQSYFERTKVSSREMEEQQTTESAQPIKYVYPADVNLIRTYSHHLAVEWWMKNPTQKVSCDKCNLQINPGGGFLIGSHIYCGSCANNEIFNESAFNHLSADLNFYGQGMVQAAREYFKQQRHRELNEWDITAIKKNGHQMALDWFTTIDDSHAECDGCGRAISSAEGYRIWASLFCEACADKRLFDDNALTKLRADNNYFGTGILKEAQEYYQNLCDVELIRKLGVNQ